MIYKNKYLLILPLFIIFLFGCKSGKYNIFFEFMSSDKIKSEDFDVIEVYSYNQSRDFIDLPNKRNDLVLEAKFTDRKSITEILDELKKNQGMLEESSDEPLSSDIVLIANNDPNNYLYLIRDKNDPSVYVFVFPSDGWDYIRYKAPAFTEYILQIIGKG